LQRFDGSREKRGEIPIVAIHAGKTIQPGRHNALACNLRGEAAAFVEQREDSCIRIKLQQGFEHPLAAAHAIQPVVNHCWCHASSVEPTLGGSRSEVAELYHASVHTTTGWTGMIWNRFRHGKKNPEHEVDWGGHHKDIDESVNQKNCGGHRGGIAPPGFDPHQY